MLLVAETGAHDIVWSVGYIIMNLQFRKQRLPWIEEYLCAWPRWLSLATLQLAFMAFFVLLALPDWFRRYTYFLQSQWEGYTQLKLPKIHQWYPFTIGQIYHWKSFTVQSVEAFFQQVSPQLRPSYQDTSVLARHCAVLTSLTLALQFSACTKSECPADIDFTLPRTWNARGFYSQGSFCSYASFFSTVQGHRTDRHASDRMKERARGFTAKVRNKLQHVLNGNITEYEVYTPSSRRVWSRSFTLPNGMMVLSYSIRGKCAWMKFYRRGITKEIEFTRGEAPKLFGLLTRAVVSAGGEPGSCWPQHLHSKRLWRSLGVRLHSRPALVQADNDKEVPDHYWNPATDLTSSEVSPSRETTFTNGQIYQWKHLPVEQTGPTAQSPKAPIG